MMMDVIKKVYVIVVCKYNNNLHCLSSTNTHTHKHTVPLSHRRLLYPLALHQITESGPLVGLLVQHVLDKLARCS